MKLFCFAIAMIVITSPLLAQVEDQKIPDGFVSLFNKKSLDNWKIPAGDNGHWKVIDGVIDYDGESEAKEEKNLWSDKAYKDFILYVDWKIKATPWKMPGFLSSCQVATINWMKMAKR